MTTLTATMPPVSTHISYSQIRAWCDCPLEHYLSRRYQPEFVSSGLRFGSSFHRAAECFYQARLEGRQVKLEELQETFDQTWAIDDETPLKLKEGESQQALKNLSGRMLAVFYKKARPGRVLAVEERLLIELEGDLPPVSVVIDLIEADDEKVSIVDFKTSKAKPTASSVDPGGGGLSHQELEVFRLRFQTPLRQVARDRAGPHPVGFHSYRSTSKNKAEFIRAAPGAPKWPIYRYSG